MPIRLLTDLSMRERQRFDDAFESIKPFVEFNEGGLKYDTVLLRRIGRTIVYFPLELMQKFHDRNCEDIVQKQSMGVRYLVNDIGDTIEAMDGGYEKVTATTIGNLAYIYLNYNDEQVKSKAWDILQEVYSLEFDKLKIKRNYFLLGIVGCVAGFYYFGITNNLFPALFCAVLSLLFLVNFPKKIR